jgi:hypothetical protein
VSVLSSNDGIFQLSGREPREWVEIWLQPLGSKALILPVEALTVELAAPVLNLERGGVASLWRKPTGVTAYRVGLAREPVLFGHRPLSAIPELVAMEPDLKDPTLNASKVSPEVAALAAEVAGEGSAKDRARRLERHLMEQYSFSLDFVGLTGQAPIDEFLFRHQQGHCELFASSMVLMLRSQGIPARLATGFLGGELNPLTGYYVVRQSNAHAWVEAYLPDEGWTIFDPTPPAGRPASADFTGFSIFRQAYDYILFRWDRYIITYGFDDQLSFVWGARELWYQVRDWLRSFGGDSEESPASTEEPAVAEASPDAQEIAASEPPRRRGLTVLWVLLAVAVGVISWIYTRQSAPDGLRAFQRLRRLLETHGLEVPPNSTASTLGERAGEKFPEVAKPTARVIDLYLHESFGGQPLDEDRRRELNEALAETRRGLRQRKAS